MGFRMAMNLTVATVLRSGGEYRPEHVISLRRGILKHLKKPHRFVCFSDIAIPGIDRIPLRHGWQGWWSKIEIFAPDRLAGRVFYMDLDTVATGDLAEIASYSGPMALLSDFYHPSLAQSGVMAFQVGPSTPAAELFETFIRQPAFYQRRYDGDGQWINAHTKQPDRLQDLYPQQIVSYKVHCAAGVPPNARLVAAHGVPKPWHSEWRL